MEHFEAKGDIEVQFNIRPDESNHNLDQSESSVALLNCAFKRSSKSIELWHQ